MEIQSKSSMKGFGYPSHATPVEAQLGVSVELNFSDNNSIGQPPVYCFPQGQSEIVGEVQGELISGFGGSVGAASVRLSVAQRWRNDRRSNDWCLLGWRSLGSNSRQQNTGPSVSQHQGRNPFGIARKFRRYVEFSFVRRFDRQELTHRRSLTYADLLCPKFQEPWAIDQRLRRFDCDVAFGFWLNETRH